MPRRLTVEDSSDEERRIPSDDRLEEALRNAVANIFGTGNLEDLTVKRVRLATESVLGLEAGFFKSHDTWKARSDQIIKEEAEIQEERQSKRQSDISPEPFKTSNRNTKTAAKRQSEDVAPKKTKRRKVNSDVEPDNRESSQPAEEEERTQKSPKPDAEIWNDESNDAKAQQPLQEEIVTDEAKQSESEMSVVLDEEPNSKPKKRQKSAQPASKASKASKAGVKLKAGGTDLDPQQAEIKRLQGWLIKCGIRKMWHRELAPYDSPKAKIKHLKIMLEEAGMKGRYSIEKARQIREKRELQADLEAVKEGASKWGAGDFIDEDDSEKEKPQRRLTKGRQSLAFLSEDGEETD